MVETSGSPKSYDAVHAQFPEHGCAREPGTASRVHFVAMPQKMPHALIDIVIDRSSRRQRRPITEVVRPSPQKSVEVISHLRPRFLVAPSQQISHFLP